MNRGKTLERRRTSNTSRLMNKIQQSVILSDHIMINKTIKSVFVKGGVMHGKVTDRGVVHHVRKPLNSRSMTWEEMAS